MRILEAASNDVAMRAAARLAIVRSGAQRPLRASTAADVERLVDASSRPARRSPRNGAWIRCGARDGTRAPVPRTFPFGITAIVFALCLPAAGAYAEPPGERFSATLATRETFRFDRKRCPAVPYLVGTTTGEGTAVPFGAVTGRGSDCVRPLGVRTFAFSRGKLVMTTADGDSLFADYSGRLARSQTLRIDRIAGDFVVTGGSGRFLGITGSGTITGTENLLTRRGQLVFEGTVRR